MDFHHYFERRAEADGRMWLQVFDQNDMPDGKVQAGWTGFVSSYHELRFARLLKYLREKRTPDGQVNYSILIYRVTEQDLIEAFRPLVLSD